MWLAIVLEWHLLPGPYLKIRFNAPSPRFAFQQRECTTSRREFLLEEFLLGEKVLAANAIKILLPGRILARILEKSFFLGGRSRQVEISRRDSCRDTRREFFPGRIPPGKWATSAGSRRDPGVYFTRKDARFCCSQLLYLFGLEFHKSLAKPGLNLEGQESRAFFWSRLPRNPGLKTNKATKAKSFGGQGCQESLAVAMLAGLYQAKFPR